MLGIAYLRKVIGLSGDEFGDLLGVNRSTVSKWEAGKQTVSKKKMDLIERMFEVDGSLLNKELDEEAKESIMRAGYRYLTHALAVDLTEYEINELNITEHEAKVKRLSDLHYKNPELMDYTERIFNLIKQREGRAAINIVLAAAEKFLKGDFSGMAMGRTSYSSNRIRQDDVAVEAIRQMINMALKTEQVTLTIKESLEEVWEVNE